MTVRQFLTDTRGNVAIMFGLSVLGLLGVTGLAIDYSRANSERELLQSALDAAVQSATLASGTVEERRAVFDRVFAAHVSPNVELIGSRPNVTVDPVTDIVTASATASLKTSLLAALGQDFFQISADSQMQGGRLNVEFALALDVSGSMRHNMGGIVRIDALKSAVNSLMDTVKTELKSGSTVKYGVVPFTMNVNIGRNNTDFVTGHDHALFSGTQWAGCVTERPVPHHISKVYDGSATSISGKWHAYVHPPEPNSGVGTSCRVKSNGTNTGYSVIDPFVTSNYLPGTRGPNYNCVRHPIMPLTSDETQARAKVASLTAEWNMGTIIAPGVSWALRLLTPDAPFPGAGPVNAATRKVIVVLTDGEQTTERGSAACAVRTNTLTPYAYDPADFKLSGKSLNTTGPRDYFSAYGYIHDSDPFDKRYTDYSQVDPSLDQLSKQACDYAKQQPGVEIYAIAVSAGAGPGTRAYNMLRDCASSHVKFFYAGDASGLTRAFEDIARQATKIRRTQ